MKPRANRIYRGKGNKHNRFKRDTQKLTRYEKNGAPAGYTGMRWQQ